MEYAEYIPELITGVILLGFAWSFRAWAQVVRSSSSEIITKLESLGKEFHEYKVMVENRVTRVETRHESLQRQVDRLATFHGTNGTKPKDKT